MCLNLKEDGFLRRCMYCRVVRWPHDKPFQVAKIAIFECTLNDTVTNRVERSPHLAIELLEGQLKVQLSVHCDTKRTQT